MSDAASKMYTLSLSDEAATFAAGALWASVLEAANPPWIIFLKGDLGAGKTTLVRGFLRGMGYTGTVKSPTYTLVESYPISSACLIYHFDLYRITEPAALALIGMDDYYTESGMLWIEWPEQGDGFLADPDVCCELAVVPEGRQLTVHLLSERAKALDLRRLSHG